MMDDRCCGNSPLITNSGLEVKFCSKGARGILIRKVEVRILKYDNRICKFELNRK